MARSPDFYLASKEGYGLEVPRKCWISAGLALDTRDDLALIEVTPPLMYEDPIQGEILLDRVAIAPRHVGASIFLVHEWPVFVHILRIKESVPVGNKNLSESDVENIAWGELYPTMDAAQNAVAT